MATGEYARTHAPPTCLYTETYAQKFNRATDKHWHKKRLTDYLLSSTEQSPSWQSNGSRPSKDIDRILRNPKVHYRVHTSSSRVYPQPDQSTPWPTHPTTWKSEAPRCSNSISGYIKMTPSQNFNWPTFCGTMPLTLKVMRQKVYIPYNSVLGQKTMSQQNL